MSGRFHFETLEQRAYLEELRSHTFFPIQRLYRYKQVHLLRNFWDGRCDLNEPCQLHLEDRKSMGVIYLKIYIIFIDKLLTCHQPTGTRTRFIPCCDNSAKSFSVMKDDQCFSMTDFALFPRQCSRR